MKKQWKNCFVIILALAMVITMLPVQESEAKSKKTGASSDKKQVEKNIQKVDAFTEGNFKFETSESGDALTITDYIGSDVNVVIPVTAGAASLPVTRIGGESFYENDILESVVIPGSVKMVDSSAFMSCTALESMVFEEGVEYIGFGGVLDCPKLVDVTIPDSIQYIFFANFSYSIQDKPGMQKHVVRIHCKKNSRGYVYAKTSKCDVVETGTATSPTYNEFSLNQVVEYTGYNHGNTKKFVPTESGYYRFLTTVDCSDKNSYQGLFVNIAGISIYGDDYHRVAVSTSVQGEEQTLTAYSYTYAYLEQGKTYYINRTIDVGLGEMMIKKSSMKSQGKIAMADVITMALNSKMSLKVKKMTDEDTIKGFMFQYDKDADEYYVEQYLGTDTNVVIPSTYKGKNVTRVLPYAFHDNDWITTITCPDSIMSLMSLSIVNCKNLSCLTVSNENCSYNEYCLPISTEDGLVIQLQKSTTIHAPLFGGVNMYARQLGFKTDITGLEDKGNVPIQLSMGTTDIEKSKMYSFTPVKTGYYNFSPVGDSIANVDTFISIYDENNEYVAVGDDENEYNFNVNVKLTMGETYYIRTGTYNSTVNEFGLSIVSADSPFAVNILDEKATIADYIGTEETVTVPKQVTLAGKTYPVVGMGRKIFYSNSNVKKITVPGTVKTVATNAIAYCGNLEEVVFEDGVENFGKTPITSSCSKVKRVRVPNSVKNMKMAWVQKSLPADAIIQTGENSLAYYISKLYRTVDTTGETADATNRDIALGDSRVIGTATEDQTNVSTFTTSATAGYEVSLQNITSSDSDYIHIGLIYGFTLVENGELMGNTLYTHYGNVDADKKNGTMFWNLKPNTTYQLFTTGVTGDTKLSVKAMTSDYGVFENEDGTIQISGYFGSDENVTIPSQIQDKKVTGVYQNSFLYNSKIKSVTIPEGVTTLGTNSFVAMNELTKIKIPASVVDMDESKVGIYASGLVNENLVISCPKNSYAYRYAKKYGVVCITSEYEEVSPYVMNEDGKTILAYNGNETELTLPTEYQGVTITGIGEQAFRDNKTLQKLVVPEGYTEIGASAFWGTAALTSLILPNSLDKLDEIAVAAGSEEVKNLTIVCGKYSSGYSYSMMFDIKTDTSTKPEMEALRFSLNADGETYTAHYYGTEKQVYIPDNYKGKAVTAIANAFYLNKYVQDVVLGKGIKTMGEKAFQGAVSLASIVMFVPEVEDVESTFGRVNFANLKVSMPRENEDLAEQFGEAGAKVYQDVYTIQEYIEDDFKSLYECDYTAESYQNVKKAYESLETCFLEHKEFIPIVVNPLNEYLNQRDKLMTMSAEQSKKEATQFIVEIEKVEMTDYTRSSQAELESALKELQATLENDNAKISEVQNAMAIARAKKNTLVPVSNHEAITNLNILLAKYKSEGILDKSTQYAEAGFTAFKTVLTDAIVMSQSGTATNSEIMAMSARLSNAYLGLQKVSTPSVSPTPAKIKAPTVAKVTGVLVKANKKKGQLKISWTNKKYSGVKIQISKTKKFSTKKTYTIFLKAYAKKTYIAHDLKSKTKYFIRVKGVKLYADANYNIQTAMSKNWSKVGKAVKTK